MLKRLAVASLLAALLPLRAAALQTEDLLALVAMPLAVAAVSEMTDVPQEQLMDVVALLNNADVPPAQFVEVVRYVPVALVTPGDVAFADFLRTQEQQGLRGTQLVTVIEDRYRTLGVPADLDVVAPRVVEVDREEFIPEIVRTRVAEVKAPKEHPHGGPPGQLKKIAGVQTGAEIVHGERPAKHMNHEEHVVIAQPRTIVINEDHGNHGRGHGVAQGRGEVHAEGHEKSGGGGGHGNAGGGGKGKGKGKG
jgi:hypothetical protein